MIVIKINKENKVAAVLRGALADSAVVDNKEYFVVDDVPSYGQLDELHFDPATQEFSVFVKDLAVVKAKAEASAKVKQALKWFADNDWKVNKRTLGEWASDDARWLAYLAEREAVRKAYDEALVVLNSGR